MKEAEQPPKYENRQMRREREHLGNHAHPREITVLQAAARSYDKALDEWSQIFGQNVNSWSEAIYRGKEPSFLPEYFCRIRTLSQALHNADRLRPQEPRIADIAHLDVFHRRIKGLSLVDIETLQLPLSGEDLVRISHFLRYTHLSRLLSSRQDRQAQEIAISLPSLDLARPSEVVIPAQLRPLHTRMTSFLDYFLKFIDSPYLSWEQEGQFGRAVLSIGPRLLQGLGIFLPARLGITPSSALKLFDEKMVSGLKGWSWVGIRRQVKGELENAYREGGLPSTLAPFQYPDALADQKAAQILQAYYQNYEIRETGGGDLFTRLQRYLKVLRAETHSRPEGFIRLSFDHPAIEEVRLASQYKKSLTMVLRFKGGGTNLAVETNCQNRLYGLPGSLVRENPHVGTLLAQEILTAVLNYSRSRYPNIEPRPVIKIASPIVPFENRPVSDNGGLQEVHVVEIPEPGPPKRKRLPTVQRPFEELKLPLPPQKGMEPTFKVDHTRSQVVKMTGGMNEKMVERVMETIRGFEWGEKTAKDLTHIPRHYRLRVGDFRVVLYHIGGNKYVLSRIEHRSKAYKRL